MKRKHLDFTIWEKKALRSPQFKVEYEKLQPEMAVIRAVIEARIKRGVTQKELAEKIGTKQSVISRIESGKGNPTLSFLKKIAQALNLQLEVRFR